MFAQFTDKKISYFKYISKIEVLKFYSSNVYINKSKIDFHDPLGYTHPDYATSKYKPVSIDGLVIDIIESNGGLNGDRKKTLSKVVIYFRCITF